MTRKTHTKNFRQEKSALLTALLSSLNECRRAVDKIELIEGHASDSELEDIKGLIRTATTSTERLRDAVDGAQQ